MFTLILYALGSAVILLYSVDLLFGWLDSPNEPRRVYGRVPIFGHLHGLLSVATKYYEYTSTLSQEDMYTIGILNFKIYVCNSRRLMPVIQRNSKTISFAPFHRHVTKSYSDIHHPAYEAQADAINHEMSFSARANLSPGPGLDAQNVGMATDVTGRLDQLAKQIATSRTPGKEEKLLTWVRHLIVQASARGVWGKEHPFLDPKVEEGFWMWQDELGMYIAGVPILARKGNTGRQRVFDAMYKYGKNGFPDDCSQVLRDRRELLERYNVPFEENMRILSAFAVGVFPNTAPTMYWAIWETFSRPKVLDAVRKELEEKAVTGSDETGFTLSNSALKQDCPLLLSIIQETQRTRHVHASIRVILGDTLLDGRYLLKKGNFLQMPGATVHHDQDIYGPDANDFDPYRFVPKTRGTSNKSDLPSSAFLAWGAPPGLCPARQFAVTEMLIILAMVVLRFDILPLAGKWEECPRLRLGEIVTIPEPKKDVKVRFGNRDGFGRAEWKVEVGESGRRVPIASG